jgi:hypothetical protein
MVAYDPRGMTWDQYCKLMCELFATRQLSVVDEEHWRGWVDAFSVFGGLEQSGLPDSRTFNDWRDWAEQAVGILNVGAQ